MQCCHWNARCVSKWPWLAWGLFHQTSAYFYSGYNSLRQVCCDRTVNCFSCFHWHRFGFDKWQICTIIILNYLLLTVCSVAVYKHIVPVHHTRGIMCGWGRGMECLDLFYCRLMLCGHSVYTYSNKYTAFTAYARLLQGLQYLIVDTRRPNKLLITLWSLELSARHLERRRAGEDVWPGDGVFFKFCSSKFIAMQIWIETFEVKQPVAAVGDATTTREILRSFAGKCTDRRGINHCCTRSAFELLEDAAARAPAVPRISHQLSPT